MEKEILMADKKSNPTPAKPSKFDTKTLVTLAMLCALAYVVMFVGKTLTPPVVSIPGLDLKFDPKDVVLLFGGFLYGPFAAFLMSVVVSSLEMITASSNAWWGLLMNVISSCSIVIPACIIYRRKKTMAGAIIGLSVGVVAVTASMTLWNYLVIPIYTPAPRAVVATLLLPVFAPFNMFKGTLNAVLTILLYKPLMTGLYRAKLLSVAPAASSEKAISMKWVFIIAAMAVAVALLWWMR
jgi:riboflavin transporter FmnP